MDNASISPTTVAPEIGKGLGRTILLTLVGFFLFAILLIGLYRLAVPPDPIAERAVERRAILEQTKKLEQASASEILWVDKELGIVSVPPERVQEAFLAEISAKPIAASSVPVNPVVPVPVDGQPAPAAPASPSESTPVPVIEQPAATPPAEAATQ